MESLLIVLNDMPYKTDKDYNALRAAGVAADRGVKVTIFLMGDAVYVARKAHKPKEGFPNLEEMVVELINKNVDFLLCTTCVNARGFEPKEGEVSSCFVGSKQNSLSLADFVQGAHLSTMKTFVSLVAESDKVISF